MNRLASRVWFFPALGTVLYLAGVNDELLHVLGDAWLDLSRWVQTAVVVVLLALAAYLTNDYVQQRRSAYRTAVRAAAAIDQQPTTVVTDRPT